MSDFQDACEAAEHMLGLLEANSERLVAQLVRSEAVYGERVNWPAASEMYVRGLEDALRAMEVSLAASQDYARELHGDRPQMGPDGLCLACSAHTGGRMPCAPWCPFGGVES